MDGDGNWSFSAAIHYCPECFKLSVGVIRRRGLRRKLIGWRKHPSATVVSCCCFNKLHSGRRELECGCSSYM